MWGECATAPRYKASPTMMRRGPIISSPRPSHTDDFLAASKRVPQLVQKLDFDEHFFTPQAVHRGFTESLPASTSEFSSPFLAHFVGTCTQSLVLPQEHQV